MKKILNKLKNNEISIEEAEKLIKTQNILELEDYAKLDNYRSLRTGFPEAIYAEGKTDEDLIKIILNYSNKNFLVTRLDPDRYHLIKQDLKPLKDKGLILTYNPKPRILVIRKNAPKKIGKIGILSAGTSDIPVAEEARIVAEESGCEVIYSYDVGIAGIHRLFKQIRFMLDKNVELLIVIAGMEGALPSVVAGLVDIPVIGVPTSVGYGVGEGGYTALNTMLQSCAPGIAVVNIDNGFGAAIFASTILKSKNKLF